MNTASPNVDPQWREVMNRGFNGARRGDFAEALQSFDTAVKQWPQYIEGWINLGSSLLQCRQFNAAANVLHEAVQRAPDNPLSHAMLGDAVRMLGKRYLALEYYEKSAALQRTPDILNRMALLRGTMGELDTALALFDEALALAPDFRLARVNRATLYSERREFDRATAEFNALAAGQLPPAERAVVESGLAAISEYHRLDDAVRALRDRGDFSPLEAAVADLPEHAQHIDNAALQTVVTYARRLCEFKLPDVPLPTELPDDWPLIEALHMVPHVHSVDEFLPLRSRQWGDVEPGSERHQSLVMEPSIEAALDCRDDMGDPVRAEVHLRHWHALCTRDIPHFMPGHFKYSQNGSARNPELPRVDPACASSTVQHFIREIYPTAPPGFGRAMLVFLAVTDLHPFADGNGRVAFTWMNRELAWAGQMPALFSEPLGFKGVLGDALRDVRNNGGDLTPMIAAIRAGQEHAHGFCAELARR